MRPMRPWRSISVTSPGSTHMNINLPVSDLRCTGSEVNCSINAPIHSGMSQGYLLLRPWKNVYLNSSISFILKNCVKAQMLSQKIISIDSRTWHTRHFVHDCWLVHLILITDWRLYRVKVSTLIIWRYTVAFPREGSANMIHSLIWRQSRWPGFISI